MGKSHILRLKLLLSLISGAGGRGFVLKGPSGADLNKERADGFLTRTNTHAHMHTVRDMDLHWEPLGANMTVDAK